MVTYITHVSLGWTSGSVSKKLALREGVFKSFQTLVKLLKKLSSQFATDSAVYCQWPGLARPHVDTKGYYSIELSPLFHYGTV